MAQQGRATQPSEDMIIFNVKITVMKTFALPKFIYPFTILNNSPVYIKKNIKFEIFYLTWDSKPDKKIFSHIQDYKNGGLRMMNIDYFTEALKAGWVRRLFNEQNKGIWKEFYPEKLNAFRGKLILESNLHIQDCSQITKENMFLWDVLAGWSKINNSANTHV